MNEREYNVKPSLTPKFKFSTELDKQIEELTTNPLMLRFKKSRANFASDRYRPLFHFVSPESTLNDPNGLCFWQGRWHLFHQGYPPEGRVHWGHAVSDDLIHWKDLPYAIYPDVEVDCFSGTTLVEEDRVIAIYFGTEVGNIVAIADDPLLLNWEKLTGKPVIPISAPDGSALPYTVFDPCLWKEGDYYYSLSGGTIPHDPSGKRMRADFLLRSNDLIDWEYLHPFVSGDIFGMPGDDGACPYFWPIGDKHILLHYSHMSSAKYIIGDYDTENNKLIATSGGRFNFSEFTAGIHAPSATPDGSGGLICIFNINSGYPTSGWNQIMSLPRKLTLGEEDELFMEPAGDIESLRCNHKTLPPLTAPANKEVVLDGIEGDALELQLEIDDNSAPMIELNVLRSPGKEEYTRIAFARQRGHQIWEKFGGWGSGNWYDTCESLIILDTSYSSELPDAISKIEIAPVYLELNETLKLRIFIDKSVVEVFVNGKQCVALRAYPGRTDSTQVSILSHGKDAELLLLNAWEMKTIY